MQSRSKDQTQKTEKDTKRQQSSGYLAAFWMLGCMVGTWGLMLPYLATQTDIPIEQAGIVFSMIALGAFSGYFIGGYWYDRRPGHPLIAGAMAVGAVGLALIPTIRTLAVLAGVLFVEGICIGLMELGVNTLLFWVHEHELSKHANALFLVNSSGALLAPFGINVLLNANVVYEWVFRLLAMGLLLAAGWVGAAPSPAVRKQKKVGKTSVIPLELLLVMLIFLLYAGAHVSMNGWLYVYATSMFGGMETSARYLTSVLWGAVTVGRLLSIPASKRFSPHKILSAGFVGAGLCVLGILCLRDSQVMLWMGTAGIGMGLAVIQPKLMMYSEERMSLSGKSAAILYSSIALGGMSLPWLCGQAMAAFGPSAILLVVLAGIVLGGLVFWGVSHKD